jgi:hypothetical protein
MYILKQKNYVYLKTEKHVLKQKNYVYLKTEKTMS